MKFRNFIIYCRTDNNKFLIWNRETQNITVEDGFDAKTVNWF